MFTVEVSLGERSYSVRIGAGALDTLADYLKKLVNEKAILITNSTVNPLYGKQLEQTLASHGITVSTIVIPDGERYKTLKSANSLYSEVSSFSADRNTPILALGGGVIGDLAGFVASTYMRGIPLFHLPTTLLSQVDSSVGGKTAVNHNSLKNIVGSFHQPMTVFSDTSVLKTLPQKEISNGLAEVIKSAVIGDSILFSLLSDKMIAIKNADEQILEEVIFRAVSVKASIVSIDEKDNGKRNTLNYGHTIGHAIESVSSYKISHGAAVAMGMIVEARIAKHIGLFAPEDFETLLQLISHAGLPVTIPKLNADLLLEAIKKDKKNIGGKMRFILPVKLGEVIISDDVTCEMVLKALKD